MWMSYKLPQKRKSHCWTCSKSLEIDPPNKLLTHFTLKSIPKMIIKPSKMCAMLVLVMFNQLLGELSGQSSSLDVQTYTQKC